MSTLSLHTCPECGKEEVVDETNHDWEIVCGKLVCRNCWEKHIFRVPIPKQVRWA